MRMCVSACMLSLYGKCENAYFYFSVLLFLLLLLYFMCACVRMYDLPHSIVNIITPSLFSPKVIETLCFQFSIEMQEKSLKFDIANGGLPSDFDRFLRRFVFICSKTHSHENAVWMVLSVVTRLQSPTAFSIYAVVKMLSNIDSLRSWAHCTKNLNWFNIYRQNKYANFFCFSFSSFLIIFKNCELQYFWYIHTGAMMCIWAKENHIKFKRTGNHL